MAPPIKDVSVAELAALLGVTTARVYQYVQDGMPHRKRVKKGTRFLPREAIRWLIDRAREQSTPKDAASPLNRKLLAEAELKELEVLERRHALIPIEDYEHFLDTFIGGFAAVASGRLQRFEREIVVAASPAAARLLTDQIHADLMEGAQEYAAHLEAEATELASQDSPGSGDAAAA
jgi:hypothetical protein